MSRRKGKSKIVRVSYRLPPDVKQALADEAKQWSRTETATLVLAVRKAFPSRFPKEG